MLNTKDSRRLRQQFADGQVNPFAAVLKCAVGIATLFVVAAGPWVVLSGGGTAAEQPAGKAVAAYPDSIEESRRVYEERRQRAEGAQEGTKSALAK